MKLLMLLALGILTLSWLSVRQKQLSRRLRNALLNSRALVDLCLLKRRYIGLWRLYVAFGAGNFFFFGKPWGLLRTCSSLFVGNLAFGLTFMDFTDF
eukprot:4979547-Pyramimonas_sp.AAC.1